VLQRPRESALFVPTANAARTDADLVPDDQTVYPDHDQYIEQTP